MTIVKYVETCCLAPGNYILTCRDTGKNGWGGGFVEIQGHKYCHDFVGYSSMQKVTVFGKNMRFKPGT